MRRPPPSSINFWQLAGCSNQGSSLILVALLKGSLCVERLLGTSLVLAKVGLGVGTSTGHEGLLSILDVFLLTEPGLEAALLEGTTVRERQRPRALAGDAVHGAQIHRCLLLRHASGQEHDSGHGRRDVTLKGTNSVLTDLLGACAATGVGTWNGHIRLQKRSLQKYSVQITELVHGGEHLLLHLGGPFNAVVSIHEDLGLDDRYESLVLAGLGVPGETPAVLVDRELGRGAVGDLEHGPPLGKASTLLVVRGGALREAVEAGAPGLEGLCASQRGQALVHLDSGDDVELVQAVYKRLAALAALVERLLEENGAGDVLSKARAGEEQLAVRLTVLLGVLDSDRRQPLADGLCRLVDGEDAPSGRGDLGRGLLEFIGVCFDASLLTDGEAHSRHDQTGGARRAPGDRRADEALLADIARRALRHSSGHCESSHKCHRSSHFKDRRPNSSSSLTFSCNLCPLAQPTQAAGTFISIMQVADLSRGPIPLQSVPHDCAGSSCGSR
mmetsp:Transcript_9553/g.28867  ORF Transcript_9553/g.28867 Transcript_9553/m.28867 type:complete len:501 (-) Transcript_9553:192-1694(-)